MRIFELSEKKGLGYVTRLHYLTEEINMFDKEKIYAMYIPEMFEDTVDYMVQKFPLISEEMKSILLTYDPQLYTKRLNIIYSKNLEMKKKYWYAQPQFINALDESTKLNYLRMVDKPILKKEEVKYYPIFSVLGLNERRWFVNLEVAESLLRYDISGFQLELVEVV